MKIIAVQNRRKGLTALKLEDGSDLIIDTEIVIMRDLKSGVDIDDPIALRYDSDYKRAKSRALWYLSRGDHSEKALYDKLVLGGFSEEASAAAVERMRELGLVDDEGYAKRMAEHLSATGISRREIYFKLINKGIPSSIAKEVIAEDDSEESEKIKKLIETKYCKKLETEEGVQKVFAALVRKGFSFSDIKDAFKAYNEELNYNEEY